MEDSPRYVQLPPCTQQPRGGSLYQFLPESPQLCASPFERIHREGLVQPCGGWMAQAGVIWHLLRQV